MTAQLYGSHLSPYTRRCTIALTLAGIDFELLHRMTTPDEAEIRTLSPLGRLPVLKLADGQVLADSAVIIRWLDQQTSQFRPSDAEADLRCEMLMALAAGATEKATASNYERTRRPEQFVFQGWVDRCHWQVLDGLAALEAAFAPAAPFLFGDRPTYADIYTYVCLQFTKKVCTALEVEGKYAALERLVDTMEALHLICASSRP